MSLKRILVVADPAFCGGVAEQFAAAGDPARIAPAPPDLCDNDADAVIIDTSYTSPEPIVAALRQNGFAGSIILIADAPLSPCPGADAALTRPLRFAKLRGALVRDVSRIGPFLLKGQNLVSPEGERGLRLTEKEAAILSRLARAPGRAVSRAELLRDVWGYGPELATRALETHVYRLRRKLERDPRRPRILLTTPAGYQLCLAT